MKQKFLLLFTLIVLSTAHGWANFSVYGDDDDDWIDWSTSLGEESYTPFDNDDAKGLGEALAATPRVTVDKKKLIFNNGTVNKTVSQTFKLIVHNYQYTQSVSLELDDETGMFSIDKTSIPFLEIGLNGADVPVRYTPTEVGTHKAVLYINRHNSSAFERKKITLEGTAEVRTITISNNRLTFPGQTFGKKDSKWLYVSGQNLTGPLSVKLNRNEMFSISRSKIEPDEAEHGVMIEVTYFPTSEGSHEDIITISGGDALEDKKIYLSGSTEVRAISVDTESLSFPSQTVGKTQTHSFTVDGFNLTGPLTVSLIDINGMYSIDKERITADEAAQCATVGVTYSPTTEGTHDAKITITGGNILSPKEISLHGTAVERTINVSTSSLSFYTNGEVGQELTRKFTATGTNLAGPMNIQLDDNSGMFSIKQTQVTNDGDITQVMITVGYIPTELGTHTAKVIVSGGDALENKTVYLKGISNQSTITATPSSWDFGTVGVGTTNTHEFTITGTNLSGRISLVSQMETTGGEFSVSPESLPASGGKVTVTFKPTSAGSYGGVFTYGDGQVSTKITVEGKCATITATPSSWDFGTVAKNSTNTKNITVKGYNLTGDLTLTLTGSGMFKINNERTITISKSDATSGKTVTVNYEPTAGGNHSGIITISGGSAADKTISLTGKCSDISATPSSWDFGTVGVGTTNTHEFTITGTNLSGRISLVSQMETTGGEFSVSPESLPASGGKVTVTFKPTSAGSYGGVFTYGDGQVSTKITVEGKCATITATPSSWDFGTVAKNSTNTKNITVKGYNLTGDLTLTLTGSGMFKINNERTITISKSDATSGKTVTVNYEPTAGGNHSGIITISGGSAADKTISLTGKCSDISATPSSWDFGTVGVGTTNTHEFTITGTNLSGRISLVSQMETTGGEFSVSPESLPASGGKVTVTFKPTSAGSYGGVFTYGDGQVSTKITVEGKCATITATPSSWDFGTVAKNSTNTKKFTVKGKNLTGDLTVSPESSSYFTVSPTTITAAQAQSANGAEVTVTYKPTARGNHSATFTISGGSATSKKINVTGTCAEITTNTTSLVFGGYNDSRTFTVTGYNLTGKLTLISSNNIFTVTPSTITASQAANGVTVTVKCNAATTIQHATGKITISGGSAKPVNVSLTLDATSPQPYAPMVQPEDSESEGGNDEFTDWTSQEAYQNSTTDVNELAMNSKVYADGQMIIIESPVEQSAIISDIAGHAMTVNLQTGRNEIPVNSNGIYIVRIREKTTKLVIR